MVTKQAVRSAPNLSSRFGLAAFVVLRPHY